MSSTSAGSFHIDEVPVQADGTAAIGVLPGRYRMSVRQGSRGLIGDENRDVCRRMILDFGELPGEVEVATEPLELDIPGRLMQAISMVSPAAGVLVDPNRDLFRWTAVENAERYSVRFPAAEPQPVAPIIGPGRSDRWTLASCFITILRSL